MREFALASGATALGSVITRHEIVFELRNVMREFFLASGATALGSVIPGPLRQWFI